MNILHMLHHPKFHHAIPGGHHHPTIPSPVSAERSALSSTWSSVPRLPRRQQRLRPSPCCSRHCSCAPPPRPSGPHGPASPWSSGGGALAGNRPEVQRFWRRTTWEKVRKNGRGSIHVFFCDFNSTTQQQPDFYQWKMRFKTTNVEVNQQLRKRKAAWWQYPPLESVVLGENLDKSRGKKIR